MRGCEVPDVDEEVVVELPPVLSEVFEGEVLESVSAEYVQLQDVE